MLFEVPLDVTLGFHEGVVGVLLKGTVAILIAPAKRFRLD